MSALFDHPDPKHVGAYSTETDTHYPNWDALVDAEAVGYVVTAVMTDGKKTWTFSTKAATQTDAKREQQRVRQWVKKRDLDEDVQLLVVTQAPLWLKPSDMKRAAIEWLHRRLRSEMPKVDGYGHLTASDETKWEVAFLLEELERKGFNGVGHLVGSSYGRGVGPYYGLNGKVKKI